MKDEWPHRGRLRPWVLGHRGARRSAVENTIHSFERALDEGADGVELDVRLSADGHVIVLHDPDLTRITQGRDTRRVSELRAAEIGRLELEDGARIPTLDEVISWAATRGALLNIELKADGERKRELVRSVLKACQVAESELGPKVVLSSFHVGMLLMLRALGTSHLLAWLIEQKPLLTKYARFATRLGLDGIHPSFSLLDENLLARFRQKGIFVGTWTVNTESEIRTATALGADVLISDAPGLTRSFVSE